VYLERLDISCFRNLSAVSVGLAPGLNFFHGNNGAGKTAILEALHFLARGRSFRSHQSRTLVQHGADSLAVRATLRDELGGLQSVGISKSLGGKTDLRVNGEPERRLSEAARRVPIQVMLPDIGELVFGGPQLRRQWLDWGAFHVKPQYLRSLRGYMRALKQRNAGLKQVAAGIQPASTLPPWTDQLVTVAEEITDYRVAYVESLEPIFADTLARLAPDIQVQIAYRQGWPETESLHKVLGEMTERELKLGSTQAGPHRADIELRAGAGPHAVKATLELSRGQGKAVASALKIAQARLLAEREKRGSVFLIDDVGAELDDEHNSRFFRLLQEMNCQILASSTRAPAGIVDYFTAETINVFHVKRGIVQIVPLVQGSPDG
jgi:DNA replication and repair protein RecF